MSRDCNVRRKRPSGRKTGGRKVWRSKLRGGGGPERRHGEDLRVGKSGSRDSGGPRRRQGNWGAGRSGARCTSRGTW